jgi:hypothetical protein
MKMSDGSDFLEPDEDPVMPETRVEIIESQIRVIRNACGVIQINASELEESKANLDPEFLNDLWVWAGQTSLGTYDYVDEDGIREESGW